MTIRPMMVKDLDRVMAIEKVSFPVPWSREAYLRELYDNALAHYYVALVGEEVVAYAGMWLILDEAHITNVAVHPGYRGRRIGEVLLKVMMEEAKIRGAERMTLEVRVSNIPAQRLYRRLGFHPAGLRKGYYEDNNEDALIMWRRL